jgi:uncharacterized protein (TIGR02453 family)
MTFTGFGPDAFRWFADLEAHNTRAWFQAHRDTYDNAVRGPFEAMLDELAAEYDGTVKVFRQHRDTRFSPDKSPYKTRTYGVIWERPDTSAGLYAEVARSGLAAGTGYYLMSTAQLQRFRDAVASDASGPALEDALAVAHAAGVQTHGEALKTAPRGFPRDHPRVALLRHKMLIGIDRLAPGRAGIDRDTALAHARATWEACAPMNAWLDAHVGADVETAGPAPTSP